MTNNDLQDLESLLRRNENISFQGKELTEALNVSSKSFCLFADVEKIVEESVLLSLSLLEKFWRDIFRVIWKLFRGDAKYGFNNFLNLDIINNIIKLEYFNIKSDKKLRTCWVQRYSWNFVEIKLLKFTCEHWSCAVSLLSINKQSLLKHCTLL